MHGSSFVDILDDAGAPGRRAFLAEYFVEVVARRAPQWQAVRSDRWKLIHYPTLERMDELYDLEADPRELRNRIADPGLAERKAELMALLERLLADPSSGA